MDDTYYDNDNFAVNNGSGSLSADGYTAVQATNNLNMANSSNNRYIYLSTRAVSGSIMKIRYKVAYAENELGSTDWITLGNYNKNKKTQLSPLNLHLVKTYPVIAPMNVEKNTAGTTILIEFQK